MDGVRAGLRRTGRGRISDDKVRRAIGLVDHWRLNLYHAAVGGPMDDLRLPTVPACPDESQGEGDDHA